MDDDDDNDGCGCHEKNNCSKCVYVHTHIHKQAGNVRHKQRSVINFEQNANGEVVA